jgi:hypothetical protein
MKITKTPSAGYTIFELMTVIVFIGIIISIPVNSIIGTMSRQRIVNEQCDSNYSFIDIAFNGDSIERLCQVKQQTITIK